MKKTSRCRHSWTRTKIQHNNVRPLLRKHLSSSKNPSNINSLDIISELPDDILVSIISLLTLREAAATRILSTRWRRLHPTANVISLTCPFPLQQKDAYFYGYCQLGFETEFLKILNWVNHTLNSYTGSNIIKKFRVDIPYVQNPKNDSEVDKLLEFALSRETEIIDIRIYSSLADPQYKSYNFSTTMISKSLGGLKYVKELSLYGVTFYNDDIRVLLLNLVALERLFIGSSRLQLLYDQDYFSSEEGLWINGFPECKLKHLIISNVWRSEYRTKVYSLMNLVSLRCDGMDIYTNIEIYNLPKLVHLRVGIAMRFAHERERDNFLFPYLIECYECHLQRLELFLGLYVYESIVSMLINCNCC